MNDRKLISCTSSKCDKCKNDFYINELFNTGIKDVKLCRVCARDLLARLSDHFVLSKILERERTLAEMSSTAVERARSYAMSAFA